MKFLRLAPLVLLPALIGGTAIASAAPLYGSSPTLATVPRMPLRDLGSAPDTRVRLAVQLNMLHEDQMESLAQVLTGLPGHRVLTRAQFMTYFSPRVPDYQRTIATFQRLGFHVVKTYANRTALDVEAPAATVNRVFNTEIHAVVQPGLPARTSVRYANVRPALLPAELRSSVKRIFGFDSLIRLRPLYIVGQSGIQTGVALGPPLKGPSGGFGPFAFAEGYDFPVQHQVRGGQPGQTYDGTGQATANVIDSDFNDSDLAAFLTYFNVTRTGPPTQRVNIDGGAQNSNDELETDLDVETIVGTSPGTALYVYLMPDLSDQSIFDAYAQILSDDVVDAANSSFGGCESGQYGDPPFAIQTDEDALAGHLLGINFSASTGDWGSGCEGPNGIIADTAVTPASGPHFIAAGGTTLFLNSDGTYASETGWNDSGGGVSAYFNQPAYQAGIPQVIGATRNLPDIAFDANPATGAAYYENGHWGVVGGTSLSSPLTTSLITQFDQFNGARYGDVHQLIWARFRKHAYDPFQSFTVYHDVIGGSNGEYQCTAGYDLVTGIGSVDGWGGANAYRPG